VADGAVGQGSREVGWQAESDMEGQKEAIDIPEPGDSGVGLHSWC
jgi:hypothetical protein